MEIYKPNRTFTDSMTIDGGHVILTSHVPQVVGAQALVENYFGWKKPTPESIARFGLFGGDLNYHTYYPNVNPEELNPKPDEFIEPMFRLLSATTVSKNWNPTDFSKDNVLKSSMNLLLGQTVNCDHSTDVGNAIGSISEVVWQEAYQDNGISIPAGINGVLKIDGKANPRIARGILMEPPSIHSNSVTVQFAWDKSHPKLSDDEFWEKIGTYDDKGEQIRRIVTSIIRYHETSLVSHGADPYAQKITREGRLNNPIFAQRTWSSYSEYTESKNKIYTLEDYKTFGDTSESNNISYSQNREQINNNLNNIQMDKDFQAFLETLFSENGLTLEEGQERNQENAIKAIQALIAFKADHQGQVEALNEKVENLTSERDSLLEQIQGLNAKVAKAESMATIGSNHVASLREKCVETYRKIMGDKSDETIINMIQADTTALQTIESLLKDYTQRLDEKFPMHCAVCGSTDISRAASLKEVQEPQKEKELGESIKSLTDRKLKNK